ncbi:MAG: glycosyltransferase [Parachlamydiales bacterium]
MITFYSIIVSLKNELGHFFEYNHSLTKAIELNGWKHIKVIPKSCSLSDLDDSWQKTINEINHKNKFKNINNVVPFIKNVKKIKKDKEAVLFIEDFNLIVLLLLLFAVLWVRPKCQLWLFHRFEYKITFLKGKAYKLIHYFFEKILDKKNVKYLTDSDLIAKLNGEYYIRKFNVFPIPHTNNFVIPSNDSRKKTELEKKLFWWPGGLIRKEKGLDVIQKIAKLLKQQDNINIVLAEAAHEFVRNENFVYIPTYLTREGYLEWMGKSDLILLPYVGESYQYKTSGIFVESICFGNIPVVSDNTWMAHELKKFNLDELVLNWEDNSIIEKLRTITLNNFIREKLDFMRKFYEKFHSINNYSIKLKELLENKV